MKMWAHTKNAVSNYSLCVSRARISPSLRGFSSRSFFTLLLSMYTQQPSLASLATTTNYFYTDCNACMWVRDQVIQSVQVGVKLSDDDKKQLL
jgi:hypothetical protein